tara:strand:+ start:117 stop:509 length:393 start_codon:yes stop_codon:yes gene_type:complete
MQFDKEKSHLSALQKVEFEESTTKASSVQTIPGIGKRSKEHLEKQNIKTIDDLLNEIQDNFTKLVSITPNVGVNNHKIFDALEGYRCINASNTMGDDEAPRKPEPLLNSDSTSDATTLAELKKLDACNIQ